MLAKALIAALVAFAFAVVAPVAGAATVRPGKAPNAAVSAAKPACVGIIRAGVVLANEEGVDPDPDSDSDSDPDRDRDSGADSGGGDTDSGAPDTGESDPGPYEPPTSDPDEEPGPGECLP